VKQILEDNELIGMMKQLLFQEGKPCPFLSPEMKRRYREDNGSIPILYMGYDDQAQNPSRSIHVPGQRISA
jgi:hypothetical protein